MKAIIKFSIIGTLFFAGLGYASAQSAASSSKNIIETSTTDSVQESVIDTVQVDFRSDRGITTPPHIETLLQDGKVTEALSEFEKFKAAQQKAKASPYHLLYCEMTIYYQAQSRDPKNGEKYAQKAESLRQELIKNYPNVSDTYILQIDENTPDDKIVELTTKAIELDPDNTNAYDYRGRALFKLGQIKEACADFEKLPWKGNMPEMWQCKDLK